MNNSKMLVRGQKQEVPAAPAEQGLQLTEVYTIAGATRELTAQHEIDLSGDKVAEFVFDDDTTWLCDAGSLHDLFPDADSSTRSGEPFVLPSALVNPNSDRGFFGDIALKLVRVFIKTGVQDAVGSIAKNLEDKHLENKEGLFRLDKDFNLQPFTAAKPALPFLLFIHGTNSSTKGAYGHLAGTETWNFIQRQYGDNVLAFQHRTLTQSPLDNALQLAGLLPSGSVLHIISHSRGGLIGDILCRYNSIAGGNKIGFSTVNTDLLARETGREKDISNIKELDELFLKKEITVKKFVRVACPAAGTKLVSKRLDHLFNIFLNLLGGNTNPYVITIKALIAEIIKTKDSVKSLPGIEAMNPDSPFIKILNDKSKEAAITDVSLAVIAGNSKPGAGFKGLKIIALKLFFWQRNDLVVNTDSMYLGACRKNNIQYFFDEGAEVDHIHYFDNNKTREALALVLKTADGEAIPGFTSIPQLQVPGSDRAGILGLEYGELYPMVPSGKKPIVVLLPGIMGSNLKRDNTEIWINYWQFIKGGLMDLKDIDDKAITAGSVVSTSYKKLVTRLSFNYDVVVYPFDWRKQLNECASAFNDTITALMQLKQPIKIIGHSMGGVLVRDFIIKHPETWKSLNASKDFRLLFLGAPLGGSFRIPAVLFGNDTIINSLSGIDQQHTKKELLTMFSAFPGILSLLPLTTEEGKDFAKEATWQKMRDAFGVSDWPLPGKMVLNEFKLYRDAILDGRDKIDYSNMVYIAGKDKFTACDYFNNTVLPSKTELVFLYTGEGDSSVTWESGIPEKLTSKDAVYYANTSHGVLADDPAIFDGIEDILEKGVTSQISKTKPSVRGEEKKFRMNEIHNFDLSERGVKNAVLGIPEKQEPAVNQIPVSVSVSNGDLAYATYPIICGHFRNDSILYAEKSIDANLGEILSARHQLGIYPGDIGSSDVFLNNNPEDNFKGAIVAGLGEPGELTAYLLAKTVEQGVANFLLTIHNHPGYTAEIGISSLIIGCGYGGLTIENAVKAIIEGVNNANLKTAALYRNAIRTVRHIEFIELYEDRALNCMYSISKIENRENRTYNIKTGNNKIRSLFGSKKRLPAETSEQWWNRITIKMKTVKQGKKEEHSLLFGASTGDAREDEKELFSSTPLIDLFIEEISTQNSWNAGAAKTIFELMIPNEFKDNLRKKGNISWVLDKETAAYPWELLQDSTINAKPLCINAGMVRQLATPNFRLNIKRVANEKALIIGDPVLDGFINQLPGAAMEAQAVDGLLNANGYAHTAVIGKSSDEVVRSLFSDNYKIIHLAGHGVFDAEAPRKSGMVIGKDIFLTTFDIAQMSVVPELVFVNCCHLGKVNAVDEKFFQDRYKLAANIGTELIEMGVKAVIAAGWAVSDEAASEFAEIFYSRMFAGYGFGDAVKDARTWIYDKYHLSNNTWGAYQCYGDPFYKLITRLGSKNITYSYMIAQEAEIDLGNLKNDLDTRNMDARLATDRLKQITEAVDKAEIRNPDITETEAIIYAELCNYERAIERLQYLFTMEKASFSVVALEKYCNIQCKYYMECYFKDNTTAGKWDQAIDSVIKSLRYLLYISPTAERYALLGSAWKRKAIVCDPSKTEETLMAAAFYYYMAGTKQKTITTYGFINWHILEALIQLNRRKKWISKKTIKVKKALIIPGETEIASYELISRDEVNKKLEAFQQSLCSAGPTMDYWDLADISNIALCRLIINQSEDAANWKDLYNNYIKTWSKAGSPGKKKAEVENLEIFSSVLAHDGALKKNLLTLKTQLAGQTGL